MADKFISDKWTEEWTRFCHQLLRCGAPFKGDDPGSTWWGRRFWFSDKRVEILDKRIEIPYKRVDILDKRVEIAENFHFSVSQMLSADERIFRLFLEIK